MSLPPSPSPSLYLSVCMYVLTSSAGFSQSALQADRRWPITLMGVISTVLLSAGVLRHYYDIYVHRTVRGISFIFVGIDAAGDVFSLISVCKSLSPPLSPLSVTCIYEALLTDRNSLSTKTRYPRNGHLRHRVRTMVRYLCVRGILQSRAVGEAET